MPDLQFTRELRASGAGCALIVYLDGAPRARLHNGDQISVYVPNGVHRVQVGYDEVFNVDPAPGNADPTHSIGQSDPIEVVVEYDDVQIHCGFKSGFMSELFTTSCFVRIE